MDKITESWVDECPIQNSLFIDWLRKGPFLKQNPVCACTDLSRKVIKTYSSLPIISNKTELHNCKSETIYFMHWHWKVHADILDRAWCIGFHMTDLPWGRGSLAYERLVEFGFRESVLTCFEMTANYDEGDILAKRIVGITANKNETMAKIYMKCLEVIYEIETLGPPMRVPQPKEVKYEDNLDVLRASRRRNTFGRRNPESFGVHGS